MSAHVDFIDRGARVAWVTFDGRGDELGANLKAYCIEHIPGIRFGRVGISFQSAYPETEGKEGGFSKACSIVVDLLTRRQSVTKREEESFAGALEFIQNAQRAREAVC